MSQSAYVITGKRELSTVEIPDASTALPGHAVVEIAYCGICHSDVEAYTKGLKYNPTLSGHEWSGTVVTIGEGVDYLEVGDRVSRTCQPPCGRCPMCQAGLINRCNFYSLSSIATAPVHGAYSPHIQVPATALVKLPDHVSFEQGALVEPATVALHGVRRQQPQLNDTVVVFGMGVIGLFAVQLARLSGATTVIAIDPVSERREAALGLGADAAFAPGDQRFKDFVLERSRGRGADIAYEVSGQLAAIEEASSALRPGGKLMLIGVPFTPVEFHVGMWLGKEIDVRTSLAHTRAEFDITVDLMSRSLLKTTGMTSHVIGLSELPAEFERLAERPDSLKVLVNPKR